MAILRAMRIRHFSFILALLPGLARAEGPTYHWPLDARPALTSTFGEYRNGRFHAGIDLKTWGQEGFPARAVDDASVVRVRTSPWGYGRAVYLKLRDGRTALYAHLSAFAPPIAERVEAEQERRGAYSVDLFLKEGEIPIKRGQIVGFSGSSGVGMPHLHFELRDEAERPVNALEHGFSVADSIPPTIRALALIPLDASALVNGGRDPYPFKAQWDQGRGRYLSPGRVLVSGPVGVAADVFDQADASASENRLAPYRLRLFADDAMAFEVTYSGFSYDENHLVDLDRNFALARRGAGRFHNLYRARGNRLPLYGGFQEGDGVLRAGVASDGPGIPLRPGPHLLRIVAEDIRGNRSEAEVEILVNAPPEVRKAGPPRIMRGMRGNAVGVYAQTCDADGDSLTVFFEDSVDEGQTWRTSLWMKVESGTTVGTGNRSGAEPLPLRDLIHRIRVTDPWGLEASLTYSPFGISVADTATFSCTPTIYPDFALVRVGSDRVLRTPPHATVAWPNARLDTLVVRETGLRSWEVVVPFDSTVNGDVTVTVFGTLPDGAFGRRVLTLTQQTVTPSSGGAVRSSDGMAEARFAPRRVYAPLFARAEAVQAEGRPDLPPVGAAYRFTPDDVPFDGRAELILRYPAGFDRPQKLGLYRQLEGGGWRFLDNRLDAKAGTVSAGVSAFSTFGLLLDETPPVIADLRPASGSKKTDRRPLLSATIRDAGAGIWREEDIALTLDGRRLISEYDPDKETVTARPKRPLRPGRHRLEVQVRDICGNEARAVSAFVIEVK